MPFLSDFAVFRCLFFYYYIISLLVYSVSCQIANGKWVILQLFSDFFYKFTVFSRFSCSHSKKINNCGEPIQGHQKSVNRQMPSEKKVLRWGVAQLCTKTPDKQIQNVESTCFTRKKSTNLNVRVCPDVKFFASSTFCAIKSDFL